MEISALDSLCWGETTSPWASGTTQNLSKPATVEEVLLQNLGKSQNDLLAMSTMLRQCSLARAAAST